MNTASGPLDNLPLTTELRSDQDDFVGYCSVDVADSQLGLLFPLAIFYPTQTPAKAEQLGLYPLNVARDAPVKEGRFPPFAPSQDSSGFDRAQFQHELKAEILAFLDRES